MITTEVSGYTTSKRFPVLRVLKTSTTNNPLGSTIVLFTEDSSGTVVHSPPDGMPIGYHENHWAAEDFEDFCGELTLKQE